MNFTARTRVSALLAGATILGCAPAVSSTTTTASTAPARPASVSVTTPLTSAQQRWVDQTLASLTLRERVGQMTNVWTLGDYTNARDTMYAQLVRWVEQDKVGSITMSLGTPIEVAAKLNELQRRSRIPLLVAADLEPNLGRLESGLFTHYLLETGGATPFPPAMAIAAAQRDSDSYDVGRIIAVEGRAAGIHVNFAPTVDVNNNPANPVINTRSFGEDPERVGRLSALFVKGALAGGQIPTAKHFPGHGDTDVDSHVGLPVVQADMARLQRLELVPFRAAIAAGVPMVMTAHIALPAIEPGNTPATLSPQIITGLLRDSLGFRGLTITDAMTMDGVGKGYTNEESAVLAVKAGADILLKPSDPTKAIDAVVRAVEAGQISRARIDSAVRRVLELKVRAGIMTSGEVSLSHLREVVGAPEHRAIAAGIARRAITLLRDNNNLVPMRRNGPALLVQYMPETELRAGRTFAASLRAARTGAQLGATVAAKIYPGSTRDLLDSLGRVADSSSVVIIAPHVRRVEGEGRSVIPPHIAAWIDEIAKRRPTIVAAFGNPYVIRQFPSVTSYLVTYGVGEDLERAAAAALVGSSPITGKTPVTLPGFFSMGDGIRRP